MKALAVVLLASVLALLAGFAPSKQWVTSAHAFEPPYDPFLPQSHLSRVVPAIKAQGMLLKYRVENSSGVLPRFVEQSELAMHVGSQSYAGILSRWLRAERVDFNHVITVRALSTATFEVVCGSGWAIGCAQWWLLPGVANLRGPAMATWPDSSVIAVIQHEVHHIAATACDQYLHGGDPAADRADVNRECVYPPGASFVCTSNSETVMDCGGAARVLQAFDVDTFLERYGLTRNDPRGPQVVVGKDGVTTISWSSCNALNQRYTTDISINGSAGVWSPAGSLTDWTPAMGWTRVPACP